MKSLIVTGIHTNVGKTFISALVAHGLNLPYWKPIQAGTDPNTDTDWVRSHGLHVLPEAYVFQTPAAPYLAALEENHTIQLPIHPPTQPLLIEGAGGLLVPLDENTTFLDLFAQWGYPILLVIEPYLGAINHTLLSLEALHHRNLPIAGYVLNKCMGDRSEKYFLEKLPYPCWGRLPYLTTPWKLDLLFQTYIQVPPTFDV
ncbi:MAG: dethiobiotin synthase [Bacteroidia bacterium]